MNSKLTPARLPASELGKSEGSASEAEFRAGLTGKFAAVSSMYDPYNGARPEREGVAKRTDLRELSRRIQSRRDQGEMMPARKA